MIKEVKRETMLELEGHNLPNLIGIAAIVVIYLLAVIFNTLSGIGGFSIFYSTVGELSDKYFLDITPAGWAFSIWGLIYIWMGISLVFIVYTVFKEDKSSHQKLYLSPNIIDLIFCFTFSLNLALNTTWIFAWDREEIITSCAVLIFMALTNWVATGILVRNLAKNNHDLLSKNKKLYWAYVFVINGQGIYTTWTTVASLLNLGHALRYVSGVSMLTTSNICLSLLLIIVVLYFLVENTKLDHILRLLLTPYLVLIWSTSAIVANEVEDQAVNDKTKMFVAGLLGISCVFLALKLVIMGYRQKVSPIGQNVDQADSSNNTTQSTYGTIF